MVQIFFLPERRKELFLSAQNISPRIAIGQRDIQWTYMGYLSAFKPSLEIRDA
jgi:hypothetical protein